MLIDPITTENPRYEELVSALLECSTLINKDKRTELISRIDKSTGNQVGVSDSSRNAAISIVNAYYGFPHNIDVLLDAIKNLEGETYQYNKLKDLIFDIAKKQQQEFHIKIKSVKTPAIFEEEEMVVNNDDHDETFESLWTDLQSILNTIDWKNIWKACSEIKEINKNYEDPSYIKSLCFTKNYELLKQLFLERYEPTLSIIKLAQSLKDDNGHIKSWLDKANHKLEKTENENSSCLPPILLIIIERLGDGQNQDKWNVQGQFKIQGKLFEISLSKNKNGIDCPKFENIPTAIKSYIDYLETDPQFRGQAIDQLRIEVFIPLSDLHSSLDNWAMICEEEATISLVRNYRLFLRSRERIRKNSRIGSLKKGWERIHTFLNGDCREISKNILANDINNTPASNIIEILGDTQISNWKELELFMKNCSILWGIRLKDSLSIDRSERMGFFESIFDSGIPIAVWNWDSIPSGVEFEQKFTECLNWDNLSDRCRGLLEKTWELRSVVWGARTETERKQYPGYYFGMLLEDPEILPDEKPLQIIGGN